MDRGDGGYFWNSRESQTFPDQGRKPILKEYVNKTTQQLEAVFQNIDAKCNQLCSSTVDNPGDIEKVTKAAAGIG